MSTSSSEASQAMEQTARITQWTGLEAAVFQALAAQVLILDAEGSICACNPSSKKLRGPLEGVGIATGRNYFQLLRSARGVRVEEVAVLVAGVRAVLAGERNHLDLELACDSELESGGLRVVAAPFREGRLEGAVVMHLEVGLRAWSGDVRAQKMEEVGRLTGGVAHDFANLMTLIGGYSEILLNRMERTDPLRAELEEIRAAANRGAGMTARLLDFIRNQVAQPRLLDLNELVLEMGRMLRPMIGEHIELVTSCARDLGLVRADPSQMARVILNLVLNARDAMPQGGRIGIETGTIELSPEMAGARGLSPGSYVVLRLTDNGRGMDQETMTHLFEPFFTTKAAGKGTGLGLNTVYGIVRQSQGDIWATSAPGKGTTFTIWMPRVESKHAPSEQSAASARPLPGNETILLVEDEEGVRKLLRHVLIARGYKVLEAEDGQCGLDVYSRHAGPVHLLVTDVVMPRMSGRELAQRLLQQQPDLKVVYISGYVDDMLVRSATLRPGASFLQKPLKPEVLAATVRELLDTCLPQSAA